MGLELLRRLQTPSSLQQGVSCPPPPAEETAIAHELFEGLPSTFSPALPPQPAPPPQSQHLLPRQSAAKLCPSLSPVHLICCHFVCEEKPLSVLGPGEAGPTSANCQPRAISLLLPWESQVIPFQLQSVPSQTAAMGTLWRHREQTPGSVGPGAGPGLSSAILWTGRPSCVPFSISYFPQNSSCMLQALPCTEKGLSHLVSSPSVLGTEEGFTGVNTLLAMQGRPHHGPLVTGGKPKSHRFHFQSSQPSEYLSAFYI